MSRYKAWIHPGKPHLIRVTLGAFVFAMVLASAFVGGAGRFASGGSPSPPAFSSALRGVDYVWGNLGIQCCAPPPSQSFPMIKSMGFNLIRVPLSWNALEKNQTAYVGYLNEVANEADSLGLYVVYVAHSCGGSNCEPGTFYPYSLKAQYSTESAFFTAWWNQRVKYNGLQGWTALWDDFWIPVIHTVDSHSSTLGYELENEPFLFQASISGLQNFNQFVAGNIRNISSRNIVFMAPGEGLNVNYDAEGAPKGISDVVLDAHCYISQSSCSNVSSKLSALYGFQESTGIPVWVGEWAVKSGCCLTEAQSLTIVQEYVSLFAKYNFANSYWAWSCTTPLRDNQLLTLTNCSTFWLDTQISEAQGQTSSTTSEPTSSSSSNYSTNSTLVTSSSDDSTTTETSTSISSDSMTSISSSSSWDSTTTSTPSNSTTTSSSSSSSNYTTTSSFSTSDITSSVSPPAIDGSAIRAATMDSTSLSITLSTAKSPDVIVVFAESGNAHVMMNASDEDNLSWNVRKSYADQSFATIYEFYAVADSPLGSDTITVTQTKSDSLNLIGFGIYGANTTSPFDNPGAFVASGESSEASLSLPAEYSGDLVIGMLGTSGEPKITDGGGFSSIAASPSFPSAAAEYTVSGSSQTNVYFDLSAAKSWSILCEAIRAPQRQAVTTQSVYEAQLTIFIGLAFPILAFLLWKRAALGSSNLVSSKARRQLEGHY